MFYLVTKRIFDCNQEAKDTMKNYLIHFDINSFDGQNVSQAIISVKSLVCVLGGDLPTNMVRCILVSFTKALNEVFKNL